MVHYHITKNYSIEECEDENCSNSTNYFEKIHLAMNSLFERLKFTGVVDVNDNRNVKRYRKEINYNSGMTEHYEIFRVFREQKLNNLIGEGKRVDAFLVEEDDGLQIQEILDNGVMNIYSYETNKIITTFALHPERVISLYSAVGEFPPSHVLKRSEENASRGYNQINHPL